MGERRERRGGEGGREHGGHGGGRGGGGGGGRDRGQGGGGENREQRREERKEDRQEERQQKRQERQQDRRQERGDGSGRGWIGVGSLLAARSWYPAGSIRPPGPAETVSSWDCLPMVAAKTVQAPPSLAVGRADGATNHTARTRNGPGPTKGPRPW